MEISVTDLLGVFSNAERCAHTVEVDAPKRFVYELSDFQKLFGRLVSGARAEWEFSEVAGGTRIRWTYSFHAQPKRGWVVRLIVQLFWARYMKTVLPEFIAEVERVAKAKR